MPGYITELPEGIILQLKVQPRSSKNQLVGVHADSLKVKLTAPPVDGAANQACCRFLAKIFQVSGHNVELISGETSRHKRVLIRNVTEQQVKELINRRLEKLK